MDQANYLFGYWPIGTIVFDWHYKVLATVVAHIEQRWLGTAKPWYGLCLTPFCPDLKQIDRANIGFFIDKPNPIVKVHAGTVPERWGGYCLSGCTDGYLCRPEELRIQRTCRLKTITYGSRWMLYAEDPGDSTVGEPGSIYVATADQVDFEGYPPFAMFDERLFEEEKSPRHLLLVDVAHYILNTW
jgi:hypothetical protein